jgi:hypothetical protein
MSKDKFECENCGRIILKNPDGEEYWVSSYGRESCSSCLFHPLNVLNDVYNAKTFSAAKTIISDFNDEFDESFLHNDS